MPRLLALVFLFVPLLAQARLEFEAPTVEVSVPLEAAEARGTFRFINTWERTTRITQVKPSCSCTVPSFDKMVFEPGESGSFEAVLTIGQRMGVQTKAITLYTDDPEQPEVTVYFRVNIPEAFQVRPRQLTWRQGDPAETKVIRLERPAGLPIHITELAVHRSRGPEFTYELVTIEEGRVYEVHATPASTDGRAITALNVLTDARSKTHPLTYTVALRVF